MTLHEHVTQAHERLLRAGVNREHARLDAELLARELLGWDRARFLANRHHEAPVSFEALYERVVTRRERREPVSYILGAREFWGLSFEVSSDVLIPRPESELIIEEALACIGTAATAEGKIGRPFVVDVGTGSGCLAIALALEWPSARLVATDISVEALVVARRNAERHGVASRIEFRETSFLSGVTGSPDLVVSNPPYIPSVSAAALSPEVRDYEPRLALFSGPDGLDGIRLLLRQAAERLPPGSWLIFEFGDGQDDAVEKLIAADGRWRLAKIRADLQQIPRTAVLRRADA